MRIDRHTQMYVCIMAENRPKTETTNDVQHSSQHHYIPSICVHPHRCISNENVSRWNIPTAKCLQRPL